MSISLLHAMQELNEISDYENQYLLLSQIL